MQMNAIGHRLVLRVRENGATVPVTEATDIVFLFRPPQGRVRAAPGQIHNGPLGTLQFTTTEEFLFDQPGIWEVQARLALSDWAGHTAIEKFTVFANLPEQSPADEE